MWRKATAACLVLAPIALTISTGVDPALGEDQGYGIYRANPDAIQWHSLLLHWAWALFVPGFLGLLAPIRRRGAVLGAIAWVSVVVGLVTFAALMSADLALLSLEQLGLTDDQLAAWDDRVGSMTWAVVGWQQVGIFGWGLSLVLTPIAAARAGVISWWTAGAALAGTVLYFVFAISPVPLCLIGPLVLVAAYGMAAKQLLTPSASAASEPDAFGAFRHRAGLVCMVAAPVSFAIGMATVPPGSPDPGSILNHPTLGQASAFFLHMAWVLFIPAVLTLAARGRRVTRIAGALTVLGLINFSGLMFGDYLDLAARQAVGNELADRAAENLGGYALFNLGWVLPGMLFALLGLIVVTVSAAVDGVVRWWVPALVGAGLAAFFLLGLGLLGVVGPLLLLGGFGAAAAALRPRPAEQPALV